MSDQAEIHWSLLGHNPVQSVVTRIAFPHQLVLLSLVGTERRIYWGFDRETRYVVITRDSDLLRDDPDYAFRGDSKVGKDRVANIPKQFFDDYDGPAKGSRPVAEDLRFTRGETRFFITNDILYQDSLCYIVTDAQARDIFESGGLPDPNEMVTDGGHDAAAGFQAPTLREELDALSDQPAVNPLVPETHLDWDRVWDISSQKYYELPRAVFEETFEVIERLIDGDSDAVAMMMEAPELWLGLHGGIDLTERKFELATVLESQMTKRALNNMDSD